MNKKVLFLLLGLSLAVAGGGYVYNNHSNITIPDSITEVITNSVIERAERSVVLFKTVIPSPTPNAEPKVSLGSGIIIGENLILTNAHVVDGLNATITVRMKNLQKEYPVEIIGSDSNADIALVKLKDWEAFKSETDYLIARLGSSRDLKAGQEIYVIGHPWGYEWSTSKGIVAGETRRTVANPMHYLQVDADVKSGNSGGPVIDESGRVIGLTNMIHMGWGGTVNFAIPIDLVKKVIFDLKEGRVVQWATIGAKVGVNRTNGVVSVEAILPNGAFDKAGMKVGDIILEIETPKTDGFIPVRSYDDSMTELSYLTSEENVVQFKIKRGDAEMVIQVTPVYQQFEFFGLVNR